VEDKKDGIHLGRKRQFLQETTQKLSFWLKENKTTILHNAHSVRMVQGFDEIVRDGSSIIGQFKKRMGKLMEMKNYGHATVGSF